MPSEAAAWEALVQEHERTHDVFIVTDSPTKFKPDLAGRITTDMMSGAPRGTFQANLGADIFGWCAFEVNDPAGKLSTRSSRIRSDLASVLDAKGRSAGAFKHELWPDLLRFTYFSPIRDVCEDEACRFEKPLLAIPLNIHRLNLLYYRSKQLAEPPNLDALCPVEGRPQDLRIAVNQEEYFPLGLLFFENLFLAFLRRDSPSARVTAERYYDFFAGAEGAVDAQGAPDWEKPVRDALQCLHRMSVITLREAGWEKQVNAVAGGAAEVTAMGDWANAHLREAVREHEVIPTPFPGTEEFFVFTSDAFPLPIGARFPDEVEDLLVTLANPASQKRFNDLKGSLPAVGLGPRQQPFDLNRCADFLSPQDEPTSGQGFDQARCRNLKDLHEKMPLLATSGLIGFPGGELREALLDVIEIGDAESLDRAIGVLARARTAEFAPFQALLATSDIPDWKPPPRHPLASRKE
ncbi:MAG TPA: hypothetical protein VFQ61_05350 [Polyangiaceae bacterium]|nr:hypothetical protein [Polyangiaceae bacterium]